MLFGVAALVVSRWFRSGTFIATGDMGPWIRRGWAPEAFCSGNHSVTGAGSAAYNVARSAEFVTIWVVQHLGGDEYAAQWAFYTLIYSLVAVGVGFLAGAFVRSELAIVAAGTFAVLNGFFLTRLPNPLNIISVGSIALITAVAVRVGQGRRMSPVVGALCLVPTSFLGFNPPMIVVAYAGPWPAPRCSWPWCSGGRRSGGCSSGSWFVAPGRSCSTRGGWCRSCRGSPAVAGPRRTRPSPTRRTGRGPRPTTACPTC